MQLMCSHPAGTTVTLEAAGSVLPRRDLAGGVMHSIIAFWLRPFAARRGSQAQQLMSSLVSGPAMLTQSCHARWAAEGSADGVRRVVSREVMELGYGLATGFPVPLGYAPRDALSWPRRLAGRRVLAPPRITRPEVSPAPVGVCIRVCGIAGAPAGL